MKEEPPNWPELSLPDEEAALLRETYKVSSVILEYGSGGSTVLAAEMPGKLVFSVESDRDWALRLQVRIDKRSLPSPATIYHVDIGPTGAWGRPVDRGSWAKFHSYPLAIWNEPFFRHPDVVLIDGRFRAACMMTVMARASRPITVLFDDYVMRKTYHMVEEIVSPRIIVGRMAVFDILPGMVTGAELNMISRAFAQATYSDEPSLYNTPAADVMPSSQGIKKDQENEHEV